MIFGLVLAAALAVGLLLLLRTLRTTREGPFAWLILGGYVFRMFVSGIRDTPLLFSTVGGDAQMYEDLARLIVRLWEVRGVHFVTSDELPALGPTALPPNLFALIYYVGGDEAHFGCVALVSFAAALTLTNLYALACELGADAKVAFWVVALLSFSPVIVFYTSDTYKDGLVACLTVSALASSIRLAIKFSVLHAVIGAISLLALWYVRFYLVFVTTAPLIVGVAGIGTRSATRPILVSLMVLTAVVGLAALTDVLQATVQRASETFEQGTSRNVLASNAEGGSGVTFDDGGSPFGALAPKLAYTVLSPFPWSLGSLGFQLGKLDAFLWYFILYRAGMTIRSQWRERASLVLMVMTFILPTTLMYATGVSNVGLIVRQRMVLVFVTSLLAMLARPRTSSQTATALVALPSEDRTT